MKECFFCGDEEGEFRLDEYGKMYVEEFGCFTCVGELERTLERMTIE